MLIIGAAALIVFGPDQLPKVARKAGRTIRDVQNTSQSFIREMERAADEQEYHDVARAQAYAPVPAASTVAEDVPGEVPTHGGASNGVPERKSGPVVGSASEIPARASEPGVEPPPRG